MPKTKTFLPCLGLCLFLYVSALSAPKHKLTFNIKGLQNTVVFMGCHYGDKDYIQDTAKVDAKGNFEFAGEDELPGGVYFIMLKSRKYFEFIIDKEQKFTIRATDTNDFTKSITATGSEENASFYQYLNYVTQKHDQTEKYEKDNNSVMADSMGKEVEKYKADFRKKHPDMFLSVLFKVSEDITIPPAPKLPNGKTDSTFDYRYYKAHFFDNVDFSEGRLVRSPVLFPLVKQYLTKLTVQSPDSVIAAADYLVGKAKANKEMFKFIVAYITSTYEASNIMGMDAVFVHMAKMYYTPDQAYWVSASQMERVKERAAQLDPILVGKKAPELALPDTSNVIRPLDSVRARYTILYFWDFDCGFCQKETPRLVKWYDSIKGEGIEVYAVQLNQTNDNKWKEYIRKYNLDWINVADVFHTSNVHQVYDLTSTPVIYILDENKKIIAKKLDYEDLNRVLKHDMEQHK